MNNVQIFPIVGLPIIRRAEPVMLAQVLGKFLLDARNNFEMEFGKIYEPQWN